MDARWKLELIDKALEALAPHEKACRLCPRRCGVDRTSVEPAGVCRTGRQAVVSHALLHFGEEPVLSGTRSAAEAAAGKSPGRIGSGTVFFAGCNLKCLFCQNFQLSWLLEGEPWSDRELAAAMLGLQEKGALNINFVSPTHVVLPILRALRLAVEEGLSLPLVWNSGGYDSVEVIRALEGIVDIYLPDLKYRSPALSKRYSGAPDYFEHASLALREMSVQQPVLKLDGAGNAVKGLIVRHLILPGHVDDTLEILEWLAANLSPHIGLSLMSQYHPCYKAPEELGRSLTVEEYRPAADLAVKLGFGRLFLQPEPFQPEEHLIPDFRRARPFRWKK
jgi:putative pyruvate formate lyase activating enzyme